MCPLHLWLFHTLLIITTHRTTPYIIDHYNTQDYSIQHWSLQHTGLLYTPLIIVNLNTTWIHTWLFSIGLLVARIRVIPGCNFSLTWQHMILCLIMVSYRGDCISVSLSSDLQCTKLLELQWYNSDIIPTRQHDVTPQWRSAVVTALWRVTDWLASLSWSCSVLSDATQAVLTRYL